MIAERAVEVPGNYKPLLCTAPVIDKKMVLVEAVPVLHEHGRGQVVDVFIQVQATSEEIE